MRGLNAPISGTEQEGLLVAILPHILELASIVGDFVEDLGNRDGVRGGAFHVVGECDVALLFGLNERNFAGEDGSSPCDLGSQDSCHPSS
jgi:hypothetical protein